MPLFNTEKVTLSQVDQRGKDCLVQRPIWVHSLWWKLTPYGCNPGKTFLMDRLISESIADHPKRQICSIMNCEQNILKIIVLSLQQQPNGVEITFISYILSQHKSQTDDKCNSSKMRFLLIHCLRENKIIKFPRALHWHSMRKCFEETITVMLHCSWRMLCKNIR